MDKLMSEQFEAWWKDGWKTTSCDKGNAWRVWQAAQQYSNKELDPKGAMISRMWDGTIDDPTKT